MINGENIKNVDKFRCEPCYFTTNYKRDYERHLQTKKHMKMISDVSQCNRIYVCLCGKRYTTRNSLWYHKKLCDFKESTPEIEGKNDVEIDDEERKKELNYTDIVVSTSNQSVATMNDVIDLMKLTIVKQNDILQNLHNKHIEMISMMTKPKRTRAGKPRNVITKSKQNITIGDKVD